VECTCSFRQLEFVDACIYNKFRNIVSAVVATFTALSRKRRKKKKRATVIRGYTIRGTIQEKKPEAIKALLVECIFFFQKKKQKALVPLRRRRVQLGEETNLQIIN
jgi:hypothetical protein